MKIIRRLKVYPVLLLLLVSIFSMLTPVFVGTAEAKDYEGEFIDASNLTIDGLGVFFDDNPWGDGQTGTGVSYASTVDKDSNGERCDSVVNGYSNGGSMLGTEFGSWIELDLKVKKISSTGVCIDDPDNSGKVRLTKTDLKDITAYRVDADTIFMPTSRDMYNLRSLGVGLVKDVGSRKDGVFKRLPSDDPRAGNDVYGLYENGQWTSAYENDPSQGLTDWINTSENKQHYKLCIPPPPLDDKPLCGEDSVSITLANGGKATKLPDIYSDVNTDTGSNSQSGEPGEIEPTCESDGGALAWIFCALINAMADAVDTAYEELIVEMLKADGVGLTSGDLFNVWNSFRIVANVVLVLAMLVIIFGQGIGGGLIDAYTVKKTLPRIVAAAILINISVYIAAFAIDVTEIIGKGLQSLLYAPFSGSGQSFSFRIGNTGGGLGIAAFIGAAIAVKVAFLFVAIFVLLPAVLAILGVFVTLLVRQGLIIFLVLVSPVAFALYCLPNTEKYFKQWWSLFVKTLLVYPIIALLFAMADILSVVIGLAFQNEGAATTVGEIGSVILMFIPLFMIPWAFKMSGGAIGAVGGFIQGLGKKTTEAIKGDPRNEGSLQNQARRKATLNRAASGLTWGMAGAALNPKNALTKGGRAIRKGQLEAQKSIMIDAQRKKLEGNANWGAVVQDSNVMRELANFASFGAAKADAQREYKDAVEETKSLDPALRQAALREAKSKYDVRMGAIGAAQRTGWQADARSAAVTNAGYIGFEIEGKGEEGWNDSVAKMAEIAGGRIENGQFVGGNSAQFRSLMNEFQYVAKGQAGRADLAGNTNGNVKYDLDKATGSHSLYETTNSKPAEITGFIKDHAKRLADPNSSKKEKRLSAQFLKEAATAATKGQAKGGVKDAINAAFIGIGGEDPTTNAAAVYSDYVDSQAAELLASGAVASGSVDDARKEADRQILKESRAHDLRVDENNLPEK